MRSLTTLVLMTLPGIALAQANCARRDVVVERLETGFGEVFAGGGLQTTSQIIEVWASAERGTWTLLLTMADGVSCVMASGTDWHEGLPAEQVRGIPG